MKPIALLVALLAASLTGAALAQEPPADGTTCFCLENATSHRVLNGCTGTRFGQDAYVTARCAADQEITVSPPWSVLAAGNPRCAACGVPPPRPVPSAEATRGMARPASPAPLQPTRSFMRAADIPPQGVGAYGIVAMRALPTPASRERLTRFCTAYIAHLPPQSGSPYPLDQQMVTVWPLDDPAAPGARQGDCPFVLDHYDLAGGLAAIADAERQGAKLDGAGPFLLGWSPSNARGVPDKVVLVVDMTPFDSQASFDQALMFWQQKVIEDPGLWRSGFAIERLRLSIADFVDHYGSNILDAVKLFGG